MAEGVRIRPTVDRNVPAGSLVVVRDVARPFVPPHSVCSTCGVPHTCKTYHLQLDADGCVMVSATVWAKLQAMVDRGGFELVNTVAEPPRQTLQVSARR